MNPNPFIGTWRLVSVKFLAPSGNVRTPYGEDASGMLMYDRLGNMAGQVMRRGRPVFTSGNKMRGTLDELKAALEGYIAYFGTYEVNEAESQIVHHVQGSLYPNWVGHDLLRYFEFSGDRLTLKTLPTRTGDEELVGVLVWEKVTGDEVTGGKVMIRA